jgi:hypothetical protein
MISRAGGRVVLRALARLALFPAAALLVHQLRFVLAFGGHAGLMLSRQGHAYLHSVAPWIVLLIGVAIGGFVWAMGRAVAGQRSLSRYTVSLAWLWLLCSASLLVLYVAQELLEGLLVSGHMAGLAGVFGYGGWWAIPAALCVGLVLAAVVHGARWVLDEVAQRCRRRSPRPRTGSAPWRHPLAGLLPAPAPIACGWSGRGPPR